MVKQGKNIWQAYKSGILILLTAWQYFLSSCYKLETRLLQKNWHKNDNCVRQNHWRKNDFKNIWRWHQFYGRKWGGTKALMKVKGRAKKLLTASTSENQDHIIQSHHFMGMMGNRCGMRPGLDFFLAPKLPWCRLQPEIKDAYLWKKADQTRVIFKSRDITWLTGVH